MKTQWELAEPTDSAESRRLFWQAWCTHCDYLFTLSLRWMKGNHADAEDALSVVKLKALAHYEAGDIANERAWLSRLLYTTCMDLYRRRHRIDAGETGLESIAAREAEGDRRLSPEELLLGREAQVQVLQLLHELPETWRSAFTERFLLDRPYGAIARSAHTSEANIRKRVQLARSFLREQLIDRRTRPRRGFTKPRPVSS